MINEEFNSNSLNIVNQILSYASTTAVDDKKKISENSVQETRNHEITATPINV